MNSIDRHLRASYTAGINIERVKEICEAEREGQCVVLPCKVETLKAALDWENCDVGCLLNEMKEGLSQYGDCRKGCWKCILDSLAAAEDESAASAGQLLQVGASGAEA